MVRRTVDVLGNATLYGYDAAGRLVKTISSASLPDYPNEYLQNESEEWIGDPELKNYPLSDAPDQDLVTETRYDPEGRVIYSQDALGRRTWSAYDGVGRTTRTVHNAVGSATDGGAHDPRSPHYHPVLNLSDRDQIALTEYDLDGRVLWTQDYLGRRTWMAYDGLGRTVRTITHAVGTATDGSPSDPRSPVYLTSAEPDRDLVSHTRYDSQGRVAATVDPLGNETRYTYDVLGRRITTVTNFVTGSYEPQHPDRDLLSQTVYDRAGRVTETIDPRGTRTTFTFDRLGRRVSATTAAGTALATTDYTCYNRGGQVQRVIRNYRPRPTDSPPDALDAAGNYLFSPEWHGQNADQNLITTFAYDGAGRQLEVTDPAGGKTLMGYDKGGRLLTQTDPLGSITAYRYDHLGRRVLVVQNWAGVGLSDPAEWHWDDTHWVDGKGTIVSHGELNDRNLPVQVEYDKVGRMLTLRDPRGNRSTYTYDLLDRRRSLTDPLNQRWETAYFNLNGTTRTEHTNPLQQVTRHDTDEAGRLKRVEYLDESPKLTPDVFFRYDKGGRRVAMDESLDLGSTWVRRTQFSHDLAGRLNQVAFDTDGDGTPEQTVSYRYEAGGLRTQLILPEGQTVIYQYDVRGQLVGVTDWEDNPTTFRFDQVGRLVQSQRANGFASQYAYDAGGRLVRLSHTQDGHTLGHFVYTVDARGNRQSAVETLSQTTTGSTTYSYDSAALRYPVGVWTDNTPYKQTVSRTAVMQLSFLAREATLTLGQGPDHGLADIYLDGTFWQSHNLYAATAGDLALMLSFTADGPHHLELRNRADKDPRSTGYKLAFKTLVTAATSSLYDLHTLTYHYDALSRLVNASYHPGTNPTGTPFREYAYQYDGAGNRTRKTMTVEGVPTITNWSYNGMNQISSGGVTYDAAGRMTSDGTNTFTWDRADRLRSHNTISYQYNGLGQRVGQSGMNSTTQYLLDLQPGLFQILASTHQVWAQPAVTTRYLHAPMGIHQQQNPDEGWVYPVQDGLGSVRAVVDAAGQILESRLYAPYGDPFGGSGTAQTGFGFTGEVTDASGLVYLRARYYVPQFGVFPSLDPVEGEFDQPPSLNRYGYVQQNPVNWTDPSGQCTDPITCAILFALGLALLGGCSSEGCQSQEPSEASLRSVTKMVFQGSKYHESGIATYVGSYVGRKNCFLTHSHGILSSVENTPVGVFILDREGNLLWQHPWQSEFKEFVSQSLAGVSVLCFDEAFTVSLKPLTFLPPKDAESAIGGCNPYYAYWVRDRHAGRGDKASLYFQKTGVKNETGYFSISDEVKPGESGSPFIVSDQIIGLASSMQSGTYILIPVQ